MQAIGKYLILKKVVSEKQEGLILRVTEGNQNEAEIISVGEEVPAASNLSVGDVVIHNGGKSISVDGGEYLIVIHENILVKR